MFEFGQKVFLQLIETAIGTILAPTYTIIFIKNVVNIEFSTLSIVELTTNWYQVHNGDSVVEELHS